MERLFHRDDLGPARASVTLEPFWSALDGKLRFSLAETWRAPEGARGASGAPLATVSNVEHFGDRAEALSEARRRADQWARSSARADELAPGGSLNMG